MISLAGKAKVLEKMAIDKSPALLTAIGVVGVVGTAVLAAKGHVKARGRLQEECEFAWSKDTDLTKKDMAGVVWKFYIPAGVSGAVTIGSIVMANRVGTKRAAALAAAYTITERAYTEYRDKVVERIGDKEEAKVRNEIAQDRVRKMPPTDTNVLMVAGGDHLFVELYTGRYFRSDIETIRKAVNEVNYKINTHGSACISDFYDLIGLAHTAVSDEMGWTLDKLMDVNFDAVLSEDGQPCVAINFMTGPVRDYGKFH